MNPPSHSPPSRSPSRSRSRSPPTHSVTFLVRKGTKYFIPDRSLEYAYQLFMKSGESDEYDGTIKTPNGDIFVFRGDPYGVLFFQVLHHDTSVWHELCTLKKPLSVSDESQTKITFLIVRPECYWQPRANQEASMKNFLDPVNGFRDITGPTKVSTGGRGHFFLRVIPGDRQFERIMQIQDRSPPHTWREFVAVSSIFS